jgi:GTPase SAR1 family protein
MSDETRPPRRPPSRPEAPEEPAPQEAWSTFAPNVPVEAPGGAPERGPNGREGTGAHPRPSGDTSPGGRKRQRGGTREGAKAEADPEAPPAVRGAPPIKIGLWGSPSSGKTTYLAALRHALTHTDGSVGRWNMFANNPASGEQMSKWSYRLIEEKMFPEATPYGDVTELSWRFIGNLTGTRYMHHGMFRRRPAAESTFDLELIDVSGELFGDNPSGEVSPETVETALDHLKRADGLIILFDPIAERKNPAAFRYMNHTLTRLSQMVKDEGRLIGQYLPYHVSVCITKFDDKDVFQPAREAGLVNYGTDGMPRVRGNHAEKMFDAMCEGRFWPDQRTDRHGGALFVNEQLHSYFDPGKVRYYATSSIGYKKPLGWDPQTTARPGFQFDPTDFCNVNVKDDIPRILGPIEPINVLEPLIELQMQITGRA